IFGMCVYSPHKLFSIITSPGKQNLNSSWQTGFVSLFKADTLVCNFPINRPQDFIVNDEGTIFGFNIAFNGIDYTRFDDVYFLAVNNSLDIYCKKNVTSLPGNCALSSNSQFAAFETFNSKYIDSDSHFIIDIKAGVVLKQIQNTSHCRSLSFEGNQLVKIDINNDKLLYMLT